MPDEGGPQTEAKRLAEQQAKQQQPTAAATTAPAAPAPTSPWGNTAPSAPTASPWGGSDQNSPWGGEAHTGYMPVPTGNQNTWGGGSAFNPPQQAWSPWGNWQQPSSGYGGQPPQAMDQWGRNPMQRGGGYGYGGQQPPPRYGGGGGYFPGGSQYGGYNPFSPSYRGPAQPQAPPLQQLPFQQDGSTVQPPSPFGGLGISPELAARGGTWQNGKFVWNHDPNEPTMTTGYYSPEDAARDEEARLHPYVPTPLSPNSPLNRRPPMGGDYNYGGGDQGWDWQRRAPIQATGNTPYRPPYQQQPQYGGGYGGGDQYYGSNSGGGGYGTPPNANSGGGYTYPGFAGIQARMPQGQSLYSLLMQRQMQRGY